MEHRRNDRDKGRLKRSEKGLSQYHFVHHKSHMAVLKLQFITRRKHSVLRTSQLTLCREIIFLCFEINMKDINSAFGQKVEFFNVKFGGTWSNQ
jgi:hypothetical protein